jgi:hypothetical protein
MKRHMIVKASMVLAALALNLMPLGAQDVKLEIAPSKQAGPNTFLLTSGDTVTVTIASSLKAAEVHLYAFAPTDDMALLDPASMVILMQQILHRPASIDLSFDVSDEQDGLGASLLAVGWDEGGLPHLSSLLTVFVNHLPDKALASNPATDPTDRESPARDRAAPQKQEAGDVNADGEVVIKASDPARNQAAPADVKPGPAIPADVLSQRKPPAQAADVELAADVSTPAPAPATDTVPIPKKKPAPLAADVLAGQR